MKIIYEIGDTVEVVDSMEVPYNLGACYVQLNKKIGPKKWEVTVIEDYDVTPGSKAELDEKWMIP